MFFKVKDSRTPIRELNHKVSRYKKWWRDQKEINGSPNRKGKGSISGTKTVDDSFVYYEEN